MSREPDWLEIVCILMTRDPSQIMHLMFVIEYIVVYEQITL